MQPRLTMNLLGSYAEEGIFDLDPSPLPLKSWDSQVLSHFQLLWTPIDPDVKALKPVCSAAERRPWWKGKEVAYWRKVQSEGIPFEEDTGIPAPFLLISDWTTIVWAALLSPLPPRLSALPGPQQWTVDGKPWNHAPNNPFLLWMPVSGILSRQWETDEHNGLYLLINVTP